MLANLKQKEYRSEEEILFSQAPEIKEKEPKGTTFAGTGPVCSKSLTPFPERAKRLRKQKYW